MGESTNTLDANGVTVEKSTYSMYRFLFGIQFHSFFHLEHVNRSKIERVCALIQSSFQASMYKSVISHASFFLI